MKGAVEKAEELMEQFEKPFMLRQFSNSSNPETHERTTGVEIWDDTGHDLDFFVAGVGTGGTITGVSRLLKKKQPDIRIVAVEPAASAVLEGGGPGSHVIQGIGAGFVPDILDRELIDEVIPVDDEQAVEMCRRLARVEGIFAGISSGASMVAAYKVAERAASKGKLIVVIFPDRGDRYLSVGLFK
jgi:cysteine synthase A